MEAVDKKEVKKDVLSVKVISNVSPRLMGRVGLNEYGKKLNELAEVAKVISPDGGLYVTLIEKSESYEPVNEALRAIADINRLFSTTALQRNPDIISEYQELMKAVETINKIVGKRKKAQFKARKARETKPAEKAVKAE